MPAAHVPQPRVSQPRVSQPHGRQHKGWGAFSRGPFTSPTTTQRREPALNTHTTHTTHPSGCPSTAYTLAVYHEVIRIVGAARNGRDVLDIANNVALSVLDSTESIMARYPKPEEFARACAHNAGHSFDRTERVQRCEGARLRTHADGTLGKQRIQMVGDDLHHFAGVQDIPEETLPASKQPTEFVFTTRLRASEISQMNLHLSKLDFVNKTRIKGVFGATDATVNLWVAGEDVPFDLTSFGTRDDYLIRTRDGLPKGIYAFHAHDVLHEEDERVLRELPREEQVAFPFEVR